MLCLPKVTHLRYGSISFFGFWTQDVWKETSFYLQYHGVPGAPGSRGGFRLLQSSDQISSAKVDVYRSGACFCPPWKWISALILVSWTRCAENRPRPGGRQMVPQSLSLWVLLCHCVFITKAPESASLTKKSAKLTLLSPLSIRRLLVWRTPVTSIPVEHFYPLAAQTQVCQNQSGERHDTYRSDALSQLSSVTTPTQ